MERFSFTFRSRGLRFLLVLAAAAAVTASCRPRGTDEATLFEMDGPTGPVSFALLKAKVLEPSCISCHQGFAEESGLSESVVPGNPGASPLYLEITEGDMPMSGPKLSSSRIRLVRTYIEGIQSVEPLPPLTPNWTSMRKNLIQRYCIYCHNDGYIKAHPDDFDHPKPEDDFSTYENVRALGAKAAKLMKRNRMPPQDSDAPKPSDEIKAIFDEWIAKGYPQD